MLDLLAYWRTAPPTHLAVAAALGVRSGTAAATQRARASTDYGAMLGELASFGFSIPAGVM